LVFVSAAVNAAVLVNLGHNLPQEAPQAFAQAVLDVESSLSADFAPEINSAA
jgi:archaellin